MSVLIHPDELVTFEDGYKYFWPVRTGAFSSHNLRDIADQLDELNKAWDEEVCTTL